MIPHRAAARREPIFVAKFSVARAFIAADTGHQPIETNEVIIQTGKFGRSMVQPGVSSFG